LYYGVLARKHGHVKQNVSESIEEKQLPAHSVSIEIYSGIAQFSCDSTAFLLKRFAQGIGI